MTIAIVALVTVVAAVAFGVVYLLVRSLRTLRAALLASEARTREISEFLARFSSGIQGEDGVAGAMRGAARHVAEQIEAEAVAVDLAPDGFRLGGRQRRAAGIVQLMEDGFLAGLESGRGDVPLRDIRGRWFRRFCPGLCISCHDIVQVFEGNKFKTRHVAVSLP